MTQLWVGEPGDGGAPPAPPDGDAPGAARNGGAEVVAFPGLNLRWLPAVLEIWRRTGQPQEEAPPPQDPN